MSTNSEIFILYYLFILVVYQLRIPLLYKVDWKVRLWTSNFKIKILQLLLCYRI